MDFEMSSLAKNETWTLEGLPKISKVIACVYNIKRDPNVSIDKCKARLVLIGSPSVKELTMQELISL